MQTQPVLIKKCDSHLYNTETASYLTLSDQAEMVLSGERFVVRNARTGEDATRELLGRLH
jgi:polyhydroxyalkanoate synthesis regulator protein